MGAEACGCKRINAPPHQPGMLPSVSPSQSSENPSINSRWADAIKKNVMSGVIGLHQDDPDVLDQAISDNNICAIHVAIQYKYYQILDYLLDHRMNVNIQETKNGNTALHLAVLNQDEKSICKLFSYDDLDDKILNYDNKEAVHCCTKLFQKKYIRATQRGIKMRNNNKQTTKTTINVNISTLELRNKKINYLKCRKNLNFNIELRGKYRKFGNFITSFGSSVGVDIDEIGMFLLRTNRTDSINIWKRLTSKNLLKKKEEIYNLLYGICVLSIKDKKKFNLNNINMDNDFDNNEQISIINSYNDRPRNKVPLQQLTKKISKILKRNTGSIKLDEIKFKKNLHNYLYNIHQRIVKETINNSN